MPHDIDYIVDEIINNSGYFIIKNYYDPVLVDYALRYVRKATAPYCDRVLERRVWDMHTKTDKFKSFAYPEIAAQVFNKILGTKHKLNTFGANRLMPGAQAQEPHTDYPYWGIHDKQSLPMNFNSSFALACQTLVPLTDYTTTNGAIEVVPGTQKLCEYPTDTEFLNNKIILELNPGDLLMYHSLLWHRAGHNTSQNDRISLLGQYTAYFIMNMK